MTIACKVIVYEKGEPIMIKDFDSILEVATEYGVSKTTIRRWIAGSKPHNKELRRMKIIAL